MEPVELKLTVSALAPGTALHITLDGQTVWRGDPVTSPGEIIYNFIDDEGAEHTLILELSGKTQNHTRIDHSGNIIEDLLVLANTLTIDNINIDKQFWELAEYRHDFNGTAAPTTEKFYGTMGCNGTVTMKFTSPFYIWLLENL